MSMPSRSRKLVDTTGAGDLFAAGFLAGEARGLGLDASLRLGAIAAAEVIQHYGARPEADLKALAGDLLQIKKGRPVRRTAPFSIQPLLAANLRGVAAGPSASGGKIGISSSATTAWPLASSELRMP